MNKIIKIVTSDSQITNHTHLMTQLYSAVENDCDIVIDIYLEGPCCETIGLYRLLDEFCSNTNFPQTRISIQTANLIECHDKYKILRNSKYWYEVTQIQDWLKTNSYSENFEPQKHFGNFVGRSTWYRLWIAAVLHKYYNNQTLQTFHSALGCNYVIPPNDGIFDVLGLDDLNQFACNDFPAVVEFLLRCPIINSPTDITKIQTIKTYVPVTNNNCYPLQHPANLMIESFYSDIFVDIVCETKVLGNSLFLSEKTWRPIVAQRPFVLMSNINSLKNLRRLGFKTFDSWWPEDYDEYSDQDRVREILKIIDVIAQWPLEKCHKVLYEMQSVLMHNYQVFCQLSFNKIDNCLGIIDG